MRPSLPDAYRDLTEIGRGGASVVFRAWQPELNRWVAIEVITIAPGTAPLSQFRRELAALGTLSGHPNIVTVHDAGLTADGTAYIVMEYLPDGTLADQLLQEPLPWSQAAEIGVKLSGALETAHRAGVLHLDVKPENAFRSSEDDTVKLGDFGIASIVGNAQTQRAALSGTLLHMAPERLQDEPPKVANDVYSLGSTLFTLIVGRPPFGHAHEPVGVVINRILHEPPPVSGHHSRGVPPALCEIVEQALSQDPRERQATAAELGEHLRMAQAEAGLVPTPMSVREPRTLAPPPGPDRIAVPGGEDTLPPSPPPADEGEGEVTAGGRREGGWPTRIGIAVGIPMALAAVAVVFLLTVGSQDAGERSDTLTTPPTPTTATTTGPAGEPSPTFVDDFSNPSSGWPRDPDDRYYDGAGAYRVAVQKANTRLAAGPPVDGRNPLSPV